MSSRIIPLVNNPERDCSYLYTRDTLQGVPIGTYPTQYYLRHKGDMCIPADLHDSTYLKRCFFLPFASCSGPFGFAIRLTPLGPPSLVVEHLFLEFTLSEVEGAPDKKKVLNNFRSY